ncbi:MAG: sterol desaturase family protein [Planctomycetes bacterium]|nr:sterol desaturase family protein [Planctomycetota bacterium]
MNAPEHGARDDAGFWWRWGVRIAALFVVAFLVAVLAGVSPATIGDVLHERVWQRAKNAYKFTLRSNQLFFAFAITFALQLMLPARREERPLSLGLFQDFWWFFYESVLHSLVVVTFVVWLKGAWDAHLGALTVSIPTAWPAGLRYALIVVVVDLLYWTQHWLHHKVPALWRLHRLHHSQRELNFFSDYRYHVLEYVVRHTVLVIPFLVFRVDAPTIFAIEYVRGWWSRFTHGNIRTNLGPLRYVFVTPQSHRVHHGRAGRWRDCNYGSILSIWDRLFRTQSPHHDVYPATGINEPFPVESTWRFPIPLILPLIQLLACLGPASWRRSGPVLPSQADAPAALAVESGELSLPGVAP